MKPGWVGLRGLALGQGDDHPRGSERLDCRDPAAKGSPSFSKKHEADRILGEGKGCH